MYGFKHYLYVHDADILQIEFCCIITSLLIYWSVNQQHKNESGE